MAGSCRCRLPPSVPLVSSVPPSHHHGLMAAEAPGPPSPATDLSDTLFVSRERAIRLFS